jgi:CBS domain-containing protein
MSMDSLDDEQRTADEVARDQNFAEIILSETLGSLSQVHPLATVAPDAPVSVAVDAMVTSGIGCALIIDGKKLVGLFSERDVLLKVVAKGLDAASVAVSDLMTPDPVCLQHDDAIAYALNKMAVGGYRHVPVLNDDGTPEAIVSMRDIVNYIVQFYPEEILALPDSPRGNITSQREGA